MNISSRLNRREFTFSVAAAGVASRPFHCLGTVRRTSANDRIQLGFIGLGTMGRVHLKRFLSYPDIQVVAVCDVIDVCREDAQSMVNETYIVESGRRRQFQGCFSCDDFRHLLVRPDVDAVVIATPDHWHVPIATAAAQAGKDIYCEKPLTHHLLEGRRLVEAVRRNQVVFQTGSQQRSEYRGRFRSACELIRNGRLGRIEYVEVGVGGPAVSCDLTDEPVPDGIDWEAWLGPAPLRGYNKILCPPGIHGRFPAWRRYREYGGGALADMGAHDFDIAQWALAMDHSGPTHITPPEHDTDSGLELTYGNGVRVIHGGNTGCTFHGTKGSLYVSRSRLASDPPELCEAPLETGHIRLEQITDHRRNWVDCMKSRRTPICDVETGHRSASICHLAQIGYQLRRQIEWDPNSERCVNDNEANELLSIAPRKSWSL